MRAAVCTRNGPPEVVELLERPMPSPGPGVRLRAHAEHACVRADRVAPKPPGLDRAQAAALCFGGTTMLDVRRRGPGALAAAGRYVPVIDRVYPFEAIRDAHARLDSGRERGSVVFRMSDPRH